MTERRVDDLLGRFDVSVIVEQQRSDVDVASFDRCEQCSQAVFVHGVDVGAVREQSFDVAEFAAECRIDERRIALFVALVDIGIALRDFDFLGCCARRVSTQSERDVTDRPRNKTENTFRTENLDIGMLVAIERRYCIVVVAWQLGKRCS